MIIEESDFRLTESSGPFWDLELLYTIKPKGKPERQEFKDAGYGMTLEHCIKRIIIHRLEQKQEVYSLKGFLEDYRQEINRLEKLLNTKEGIYGNSKENKEDGLS